MQRNSILYLLLILSMAIWGLSWTNGKVLGYYSQPAPVLMFWRFAISSIAMAVVLWFRKQSFRLTRKDLLTVIGGGMLLAAYNVQYFTGTRLGAAGAGGVLVTTLNPIVTFLLVVLVTRQKPTGIQWLGIILGFTGGALILEAWSLDRQLLFKSGNIYFLGCAVTWAFLTLLSSRSGAGLSNLIFSFWVYLLAALISLGFVPRGALFTVFTLDHIFWLNLASISLGAMAFATTIYFLATVRLGSARASAFIFTVPLSAMAFSMILLDERLQLFTALGGTLSIFAVYLINLNAEQSIEDRG